MVIRLWVNNWVDTWRKVDTVWNEFAPDLMILENNI